MRFSASVTETEAHRLISYFMFIRMRRNVIISLTNNQEINGDLKTNIRND